MDTIETMRAFLAVVHEGSFTGGARRLGLSPKLVSKRVAALETRLGTQLFARTTRSVSLTDAGETCRQRLQPMIEQFDELEASLREHHTTLAGPIRMTAPTAFGSHHLTRSLGRFMARHPEVSVKLHLTNARVSLTEDGFDLGVRIGKLADSNMIARRLAPMPLVACASGDYLARAGRPERPTDLSRHDCLIDENSSDPKSWRFQENGRYFTVRVNGRFWGNAPASLAEMAVAGLGIAHCVAYVVAEPIIDGRLIPLLREFQNTESGLYAVYPPNRHLPARVRALLDHLAAEFHAAPWARLTAPSMVQDASVRDASTASK